MATYNQAPNIGTYSFRPYQQPNQDLFGAVQARSAYWLEGARQIKSAYEQAANLQLAHKSSKDKLQNFMLAADEQIKKASRTDLSVAQNVQAGMDIFKPLYQDRSLMLDDQTTTFYREQMQIANNAKTQDGGKNYSSYNEGYMMEKYQEFVSDEDENNWEKHYNEKRGYTPYYDYRTEFDDILKNCKPDSVEGNTVDGLYFINQKEKVLSSTKLNGCLQSGLSDRAKNQLRIEGYMTYGKNYEAVGQSYLDYSGREIEVYGKKKAAIQGQLQGLRDRERAGKLTEEEKVALQGLQQSLQGVESYLADQLKTREVVASGNYKYIKDNYEQLAGSLYLNDKLGQYANYHSFSDVSRKMEENNAAMLQYKAQVEATQMGIKFQQDQLMEQQRQAGRVQLADINAQNALALESMKASGRLPGALGMTGAGAMYPDLTITDMENVVGNSEKEVNDRYNQAVQSKGAADQYLYEEFRNIFPNKASATELIQSEEFANYMKTNPDDVRIKRWLQVATQASKDMNRMQAIKQSVEDNIRTNNPDLLDDSNLANIPSVTFNGEVITAQRMRQAMTGSDPSIQVVEVPSSSNVVGGSMFGAVSSAAGAPSKRVFYRGMDITNSPGVRDLMFNVTNADRDRTAKLAKVKADLFGQERIRMDKLKSIGSDNKDKTVGEPVRNRIGSVLGIPQNKIQNNVFLHSSDLKGTVYVDINGEDVPEDLEDRVKQIGGYKVSENRYEFKNVPEYNYFQGDDFYTNALQDIDNELVINRQKINSGTPHEIPILSQRDVASGSMVPSYKMTVKKGILPGQLFYELSAKQPDGTYKKSLQEIRDEAEALKVIQLLDKQR